MRFGNGVAINGVPINPDTQLPAYVPQGYILRKIRVVGIMEDGNDVLQMCKESINSVEDICNKLISIN